MPRHFIIIPQCSYPWTYKMKTCVVLVLSDKHKMQETPAKTATSIRTKKITLEMI